MNEVVQADESSWPGAERRLGVRFDDDFTRCVVMEPQIHVRVRCPLVRYKLGPI